jgi:hypothetical protein
MNDEQIKALWLRVTGFDADGDAADIIGFARALLADGGKGEAVAKALDHCDWSGAPIGNKVIIQQAIDVLSGKPSMTNGSFHCPACGEVMKGPTHCGHCLWDADTCGYAYAAPQAECAPREAQPVGPRTTLNYDGTFDTPCAHCGGNGCFACLKSAAPTPERAPREAQPVDQWLRDLRRAHEYLDKGEPFFTGKDCAELADLIESLAAPTPEKDQRSCDLERADAGKDAALTDEEIVKLWIERPRDIPEHRNVLAFARAILTAKEKK